MRRVCLTLVLALAAACATNPVTGKREVSFMSEAQEIQIGQQQDAEVRREMGVYRDAALQEYVSGIGMKLARASERPDLPWHFTVVDSPAVNAFALPGGYIYITRGILPFLDNEAQLAGVLGHEIGHVTARHAAQQYSRSTEAQLGLLVGSILVPQTRPLAQLGESGFGLLFLKYSRDDEAQADGLGVKYAARTGWDPAGVPQMLTTLGRIEEVSDNKGVPNWLSTHPAPEDRVQRVSAAVQQAEAGADRFAVERDAFLKRIDGIVYGDNPDQGVVRGGRFLHAGLRFAVEFPNGWEVNNGQTQVVAKEPGGRPLIVRCDRWPPLVSGPPRAERRRSISSTPSSAPMSARFRISDGSRSGPRTSYSTAKYSCSRGLRRTTNTAAPSLRSPRPSIHSSR